jgi:hypothetical protein
VFISDSPLHDVDADSIGRIESRILEDAEPPLGS